jgi:hypothetical protein
LNFGFSWRFLFFKGFFGNCLPFRFLRPILLPFFVYFPIRLLLPFTQSLLFCLKFFFTSGENVHTHLTNWIRDSFSLSQSSHEGGILIHISEVPHLLFRSTSFTKHKIVSTFGFRSAFMTNHMLTTVTHAASDFLLDH